MKMLQTIVKVEYLDGYRLKLHFKNGKIKIFDMEDRLKNAKNMFLPLKDLEFFKQVKCEDGTIVWPNGVDLCPDTLYQRAKEVPSSSKRRKTRKSFSSIKARKKLHAGKKII